MHQAVAEATELFLANAEAGKVSADTIIGWAAMVVLEEQTFLDVMPQRTTFTCIGKIDITTAMAVVA